MAADEMRIDLDALRAEAQAEAISTKATPPSFGGQNLATSSPGRWPGPLVEDLRALSVSTSAL